MQYTLLDSLTAYTTQSPSATQHDGILVDKRHPDTIVDHILHDCIHKCFQHTRPPIEQDAGG